MFRSRGFLFLLIASLCLEPLPAHALRPQPDRAGVEANLAAAGAEEVQRLAETWVSEGAAASSVARNSGLRRKAVEAIKAIAYPKVLAELLQDRVHTDRIWPGQVWWVPTAREPLFPLAQVSYRRSGPTLYVSGAKSHVHLEADVPFRGPLSLQKDLWVRDPESSQRIRLPVFLHRYDIPLRALNTESFTAIVAGSRGRHAARRFPHTLRVTLDPEQGSMGTMGARWKTDTTPWVGWVKNGRLKVLSHVHSVNAILSSSDILATRDMSFITPMFLMNSIDQQSQLFIPKGLGGLVEAAKDLPDEKVSLPFDDLTAADRLEWLRRYYLVIPVDLAALGRARRLPVDTTQPERSPRAAVNRVLSTLKLIFHDRPFRPVVVGASVAQRYPALYELDGILPSQIFAVDPGGDKTAALARLLAKEVPPVDQVRYHGLEDEHRHFVSQSAGLGISAGDQPVDAGDQPAFYLALQRILVSMSDLSPDEMERRGINLRQLAADLEFLRGA